MEDKKDILESLAGVTRPKQTDDIIDNAVTQSAQYYCDALTDEKINDVLGDCDTHLITLVGFSEVGKSTFVASLYHKVMSTGEIDGYKFIDSDTYIGFERRAYIRNEDLKTSKRNSRTTTLEGQFLTLTLTKNEKIKKLINSHHIVFFVDSSSINNEDDYDDFCDEFQLLLGRMASAGVFAISKVYDIIYNKIELNSTDEEKTLYTKQSQELENMLKNDYGINLSNRFEITANNMQDKELNHVFDYFVNTLNGQIICQQAETNWVQTLLNE